MAVQTTTTPGGTPAVIDLTRPMPGRRNVLGDAIAGLAGAMILAGAGVTMATPDGTPSASAFDTDHDLQTACAEFDRLERQQLRVSAATGYGLSEREADRINEPAHRAQGAIFDRLVERRATTLAGIQAKAASLVLWAPDVIDPQSGMDGLLIASILGDLLGIDLDDDDAITAARQAMRANRFVAPAVAGGVS